MFVFTNISTKRSVLPKRLPTKRTRLEVGPAIPPPASGVMKQSAPAPRPVPVPSGAPLALGKEPLPASKLVIPRPRETNLLLPDTQVAVPSRLGIVPAFPSRIPRLSKRPVTTSIGKNVISVRKVSIAGSRIPRRPTSVFILRAAPPPSSVPSGKAALKLTASSVACTTTSIRASSGAIILGTPVRHSEVSNVIRSLITTSPWRRNFRDRAPLHETSNITSFSPLAHSTPLRVRSLTTTSPGRIYLTGLSTLHEMSNDESFSPPAHSTPLRAVPGPSAANKAPIRPQIRKLCVPHLVEGSNATTPSSSPPSLTCTTPLCTVQGSFAGNDVLAPVRPRIRKLCLPPLAEGSNTTAPSSSPLRVTCATPLRAVQGSSARNVALAPVRCRTRKRAEGSGASTANPMTQTEIEPLRWQRKVAGDKVLPRLERLGRVIWLLTVTKSRGI
ncbi:hypothetical protein BU15DRAFT_76982 [Melanogaster broomeanus]|nr:hypothetical protein BU15DRAFT_76982 [Melanogaster broomeanus]